MLVQSLKKAVEKRLYIVLTRIKRKIYLCIVSIAVKGDSMLSEYLAERQHIKKGGQVLNLVELHMRWVQHLKTYAISIDLKCPIR